MERPGGVVQNNSGKRETGYGRTSVSSTSSSSVNSVSVAELVTWNVRTGTSGLFIIRTREGVDVMGSMRASYLVNLSRPGEIVISNVIIKAPPKLVIHKQLRASGLISVKRYNLAVNFMLRQLLQDTIREAPQENAQAPISRSTTLYENDPGNYVVPIRTFINQFSHMYQARMHQLRPLLLAKMQKVWPDVRVAPALKDAPLDEVVAITGITYKDMALKPSALKAYLQELEIEKPRESFMSDTDSVYLEDEFSRLRLLFPNEQGEPDKAVEEDNGFFSKNLQIFKLPRIKEMISGLVIAVCGSRGNDGRFQAQRILFPGPMTPSPLCSIGMAGKVEPSILVVADLRLGSPEAPFAALRALRDYICGDVGIATAAQISRLVVIGNSFYSGTHINITAATATAVRDNAMRLPPLKAIEEADAYFASLAESINIDIVPGPKDPTNYTMPQQKLHAALLPRTSRLATAQSLNNPTAFSCNSLRFAVLGNQSVESILDFTAYTSPLDALKLIATSHCLVPGAPDTVACYPFDAKDPFVLPDTPGKMPHVLLSGGHTAFKYSTLNEEGAWLDNAGGPGLTVVSVPSFHRTKQAVMINLGSKSISSINFE